MTTKIKIERGDHVTLCANEEEGWTEECGWVLEVWSGQYEGMLLVGLCAVADGTLEPGDDGLRELESSQVKEVRKASEFN